MYLWVDDLENAGEHFQLAEEMGMGELATPEASIALLALANRFDTVSDQLRALQLQRGLADDWVDPVMMAIREEGDVEPALQALIKAYDNRTIGSRLYLGALYFIGDEAAYFDGLDRLIDEHAAIDIEILFTAIAEGLRQSPKFENAMQRLGIVAYWQERGKPPL